MTELVPWQRKTNQRAKLKVELLFMRMALLRPVAWLFIRVLFLSQAGRSHKLYVQSHPLHARNPSVSLKNKWLKISELEVLSVLWHEVLELRNLSCDWYLAYWPVSIVPVLIRTFPCFSSFIYRHIYAPRARTVRRPDKLWERKCHQKLKRIVIIMILGCWFA